MLNKALTDLIAEFNREIDKLDDDFDNKLKHYSKNRDGGRVAQIDDRRHHHARSICSSRSDRYDKEMHLETL